MEIGRIVAYDGLCRVDHHRPHVAAEPTAHEETFSRMYVQWRDTGRWLLTNGLFFLPQPRRKALDRWLRGREEHRKLQLADYVLMSWGKSGRTWLRVMLSRFYQIAYGVPEGRMLEFDNLKRSRSGDPERLLHPRQLPAQLHRQLDRQAGVLRQEDRDAGARSARHRRLAVLSVEVPDAPVKKMLNDYPAHGADVSIFDFVMNQDVGLPEIIAFLEMWERELPRVAGSIVVRYEDMRADPEERAAARARVPRHARQRRADPGRGRLRRLRQYEAARAETGVLAERPASARRAIGPIPQSYKVRRAKVGGWRDYFDDGEVAAIDALLAARPKPPFGYGVTATAQRSA